MGISKTDLPGCLLIRPEVHQDARGFFYEGWNSARPGGMGLPAPFVQYNVSGSARGVLRGLHYQWPNNPQGKLVSVASGEVFDVAVDIRRGSPTFGRHFSVILSAANRLQFWIPPGFAHGFLALSDFAVFTYFCTAPYDPASDNSLRWDDPSLGIEWPLADVQLSPKDASAPSVSEIAPDRLPVYSSETPLQDPDWIAGSG